VPPPPIGPPRTFFAFFYASSTSFTQFWSKSLRTQLKPVEEFDLRLSLSEP